MRSGFLLLFVAAAATAGLNRDQRAVEAPTILVTNQATLSDGENFTEGFTAR